MNKIWQFCLFLEKTTPPFLQFKTQSYWRKITTQEVGRPEQKGRTHCSLLQGILVKPQPAETFTWFYHVQ